MKKQKKINFDKFKTTDNASRMIARFEELAIEEALRVLEVDVFLKLSHLFTTEQEKSIHGIIEIVSRRYRRESRREPRSAELKLWLEQEDHDPFEDDEWLNGGGYKA